MAQESFVYTATELAESMTGTVHDTLNFLVRYGYITEQDHAALINSLVVYALPNRKGFGQRIRERFFGSKEESNIWVFPIVAIDDGYIHTNDGSDEPKKPKLTVVQGMFGKPKPKKPDA